MVTLRGPLFALLGRRANAEWRCLFWVCSKCSPSLGVLCDPIMSNGDATALLRWCLCSYCAHLGVLQFFRTPRDHPEDVALVWHVIIMMVQKWSDLVSGAKFKTNTVSLHGNLPTHVYAKFKTDWNWRFWIFHEYLKMAGDERIKLYMPIVCNMCKQYLSCNVKWRHSFWCYWRR